VEETVRTPFATRQARGRRMNYFKTIAGYNIRVTVVTTTREPIIVTVWKEPLH
jgi:hypothetical protein